MTHGPVRPFISAKFSPTGRTHSFLLPELALDPVVEGAAPDAATSAVLPAPAPQAGDAVIVRTIEGPAFATVTRTIPQLAERRRPAPDSGSTVVRKATHEDIVTKLKQQQREQDAHRVCLLKIRERGLQMKLTRVEQL